MRIKLLGSHVDALTMEETIQRVKGIIQKRLPTQHVVINASKINLMKKNEKLQQIVNECPLINADGISILLAARFLNKPLPERVTGIDMMERLFAEANREKYRIFLLGAKEEVVIQVKNRVEKEYPQAKIVGYQHGYFERSRSQEIAQAIREKRADILFVAFTSPEKEFWVHEHLKQMNVPFVMGVGGSFDVFAGKISRAPKWVRRIGSEWLWRLCKEPRRMYKRYLIGNFVFLRHLWKEKRKERKRS